MPCLSQVERDELHTYVVNERIDLPNVLYRKDSGRSLKFFGI